MSSVKGAKHLLLLKMLSMCTGGLPAGLNDSDTQLVFDELDKARDTLAQIQALQIEMGGAYHHGNDEPLTVSNDSMTSGQWLGEHGLKCSKLMFEDLVGSLAFKHCNGTIQIPRPPKHMRGDKVEVVSSLILSISSCALLKVPHTRVVHAQYCKEFVHMRYIIIHSTCTCMHTTCILIFDYVMSLY